MNYYQDSQLRTFLANAPVAVCTGLNELPNLVPGHILMNAARPLLGQQTFQGDFLRGRFYAALDPTDSFSEVYARENLKLDGKVVCVVTREQATALILDGCRYRDKYMAMEDDERWSILCDQISKLQDLAFAEFMEKLEGVALSTSKGPLPNN
ncbi:TPA: hypothetical protein ACP32N_005101 [Pseudomonas aeruginosa]